MENFDSERFLTFLYQLWFRQNGQELNHIEFKEKEGKAS